MVIDILDTIIASDRPTLQCILFYYFVLELFWFVLAHSSIFRGRIYVENDGTV